MHKNTITNWLKKEPFRLYYSNYEPQVYTEVDTIKDLSSDDVDERLAQPPPPASNALGTVLMNKPGSDQARVNAGKFVLNTIYMRLLDTGQFAPKELEELRKSLALVTK